MGGVATILRHRPELLGGALIGAFRSDTLAQMRLRVEALGDVLAVVLG